MFFLFHTLMYVFPTLFEPILTIPEFRESQDNPKLIHGRFTRDIKDFHLVIPQKVHPDGSFYSHNLQHHFPESVRKKRNLDGDLVHYRLDIHGAPHILELQPYAHITSPSMLVETRAEGSDLTGVTFRRPRRHLCHFRGVVRDHPHSRVAVSGCDGLVGLIRTGNGTYFVEPIHGDSPEAGVEHVHVVYKRSVDPTGRSCTVKGDWWNCWWLQSLRRQRSKHQHKRSEAGTSVQRWYEAMVVADKKFLMFHRNHNVEEYIICIMNMVSDLYHDASVGNLIDISIVRIVYLEKEEQEMDLEINTDGEDTLTSFCTWQYNMNPKDVNHPNHHDVGVLFTRYDICADNADTCSLMGLAHLGTACSKDKNCCINEDSGLLLGVVTTHELGHTLGCTHDAPEESGCDAVAPAGDSTVMNPMVRSDTSAWSPCSRGFITGLFDSQMGECLLDEPQEHSYPLDEMPPGAFYDASQQCIFLFGPSYTHYDELGDKFCEQLWCKEKDGVSVTSMGDAPADGTKCGPNKWCYNKKCVEIGERPAAVNGEWGAWGQWTDCSRTCGGGVTMRERLCNKPVPSNKGRYCQGKRHEYNMCNVQKCEGEGRPTFREVQCSEFDSKPFKGTMTTWKPYSQPDNDANPCALFCVNAARVFTKLAPRVKDGTRCKPGTYNSCIQGACLAVGCDWKIGSDAVEDVCGICEGDGTHCTVVEQVYKDIGQGYVPLVTVPQGATNVKLEEVEPSENMIAVSAFSNATFYLNGGYTEQRVGEYDFGGVKGIHSKPQKDKEELHIKGPLKEPLVLYGVFFGPRNPGIRYAFAIPSEKRQYEPKYHWEFVEWSPCTAVCGGGTQIMIGSCIEERDGKVKDSFCRDLPKEEPRARTCNEQPCETRWKVWPWGPCSGCLFQSGVRTRQVECIKQNPTDKGDEEIITDPSECCGEPPKKTELCNSPRPCPKNMTSAIVKKRQVQVMTMKELKKRSADEGQSFSDVCPSSTPGFVKDPVHPESVRLQEVLLDESHLNLTEQEYEEVGDLVPDKVLACPIQTLTGQEAMERLAEMAHGEHYHKNITKINNHKNGTKSEGQTTPRSHRKTTKEASVAQTTCQVSTCKHN